MGKKQIDITNQNLMDMVPHGNHTFPIQYFVDECLKYTNQQIPLHWHTELEFYVARGGAIQIQINNTHFVLKEGSGIFINSNVLHAFQQCSIHDNCQCPNIVFSSELIAPMHSLIYQAYIQPILNNQNLPFIILDFTYSWQKEILNHLDIVFSLLQRYGEIPAYYGQFPILSYHHQHIESACFALDVVNHMNRIWQILFTHLLDIPNISNEQNNITLQIRMQKMLQFIHEHYAQALSLHDIAHAANISKSEASRCFQQYLHDSPVHYLLSYRLAKAKLALQNQTMAISEIASSCGFSSTSYFGKLFRKKTGVTPMQYRATHS